ncbi:hypothetical protein KC669_02060 [Candidatus Dojkabacteria bacterium]|uniref:Glycosyltransferase n=1 Tax=Candidatus Dojkabacteria bacterium TaxID=2099670 RepID=A0A955LAP6_9BACT|nr:hypothetical protein [Candidatus Dojkabacteria bacterium]
MLYELLYNLGKLPLPGLINDLRIFLASKINKLDSELIPLLENTDVIISTHFMITEQLLRLRRHMQKQFKIVNYVPDFDEANIHKVHYKGAYCDGYIAQSDKLVASLQNKDIKAIMGRFIPSEEFSQTNQTNKTLLDTLNQDLETKISLDFSKKIVCVTGGAMWAKRLMPRLSYVWKDEILSAEDIQYIIVTGRNNSFFNSFQKFKNKFTQVSIQPVPFLNATQLSALYSLSDIVLMASIAPASLYEIGAVNKPVIILGRKNPGQEYFNARYAKENNLITPANGKHLLLNNLINLSKDDNFKKAFTKQSEAFKKEEKIQIDFKKNLLDFIRNI